MLYEIFYLKNKYKLFRKLLSKLIPAVSVFLLLLIFVTLLLSVVYQNSIIFYIFLWILIIFYVWWLIRWFEYIILILFWFIRYKNFQKLNIKNIFSGNVSTKQEKLLYYKYKRSKTKKEEIYHWVVIPTCYDPYEMIQDCIESIKDSDFDNKKIIITLAWEEKDKNNFNFIKDKIKKKYSGVFLYMNTTIHPCGIEWEIPWKGSNVSYAMKLTYKDILNLWLKEEQVIVSVLDSESIIQKIYFDALTLEYCLTNDDMQDKTIYQPMLFLVNNFFNAPFFSKIMALSVSFYILWASIKWIWARAQAVQAQNLKSLLKTNFYSVETITEDWHQYYRTYCVFEWKFQVKPVYTYVLLEPVIWKTLWETIKLQYNQIKRWAHWVLDFPYILICFFVNKKLPKIRTLYEIFRLLEASVLWSSLQFILFFGSIFFYLLWWIYSNLIWLFSVLWFFVLTIILIITLFFIPWSQINSKRKKIYELGKFILFSFTFMWPLLLILNWLPALHAHILILIWKPLWKFNVTKKYR